jgi:hypothetical protein
MQTYYDGLTQPTSRIGGEGISKRVQSLFTRRVNSNSAPPTQMLQGTEEMGGVLKVLERKPLYGTVSSIPASWPTLRLGIENK